LNANDVVEMKVTFSEPPISAVIIVDNTSAATLTLVVGNNNRTATYTSGDNTATSGSNARLVFLYTIQATGTSGENDSNGISIGANALALNSGTIRDAALNDAILTHSVVDNNSSYKVDTILPTVSSVEITSAPGIQNSFLNAGDNVSVTATFSETVNVDNASGNPTITLVVGSDNRTATYTSGSGSTDLVFRYTIQATGTSGENDSNGISIPENALALNSGTIRDPAHNNATLTHSAVSDNSSVKVDTTLPTVSVAITGEDGIQGSFLNAGDNVSVTATFSETVNVDNSSGNPRIILVVGDDNRTAAYTSGSGSTELVFEYMIKATGTSGENDSNGISIGANALALNSGTIRDAAGNNATLTHSAVSANTSYKVDTTAPSVNSFTLSDTALKVGDTATVTLVFSEAVTSFSSAADITVANGTLAVMTSTDNITWAGTFTPTANTEEDNNTLSLATSYTDLAGNAGTAETTANYAIDTLVPTISSVTAGWGAYLNATEDNSSGTVTVVTSGAENDQTVTVTLNDTDYTGTVSDNSTAVTIADTRLQP